MGQLAGSVVGASGTVSWTVVDVVDVVVSPPAGVDDVVVDEVAGVALATGRTRRSAKSTAAWRLKSSLGPKTLTVKLSQWPSVPGNQRTWAKPSRSQSLAVPRASSTSSTRSPIHSRTNGICPGIDTSMG